MNGIGTKRGALLLFFGLTLALPALGQPLIVDEIDPAAFGIDTARERAEGLRHRYVTVNPGAKGQAIGLTLFQDAQVSTRLRQAGRQLQTTTWVGSVDGDPYGSVVLGFHDDGTIAGTIETEGRVFVIRPKGRGIHAVVEMGEDAVGDEGNDVVEEEPAGKRADIQEPAAVSICEESATCPAQTVDLMVVYTSQARTALGGTDAAAQAAISAAVAEMNEANRVSGVIHSVRLVYAGVVDYVESGSIGADLSRLRAARDGYMDDVHVLRDAYRADVVSLVTDTGGCGVAYVQTDPTLFDESLSFNVLSDLCMTGNKTLTHEVGHNLGLHHDWFVTTSTRPCTWSHGYVNQAAFGGTEAQRWRSVMSYEDQCINGGFSCRRLAAWSNPQNSLNGDPMGIDRLSPTEPSDATFVLNRSICQVAQFRTAQDPLLVVAPNGGETWTQGTNVTFQWTGTYTANVDVLLQRAGSTVRTIGSNLTNTGSLAWTVPADLTPACDYSVRVQATSKSSTYDSSNGTFCIQAPPAPTLAVSEPASNQTRLQGAPIHIAWQGANLTGVHLRLMKDGQVAASILEGAAVTGSLDWQVPTTVPAACGYVVRAVSSTNSAVLADAPGTLCVEEPIPPGITVSAPNGGETWTVGVQETITWTSQGVVGPVDIHLLNAQAQARAIALNLANSGTVAWVVPTDVAVECGYQVRVREAGGTVADVSDQTFCVTRTPDPKLAVTNPKTGTIWVTGSGADVAWQGTDVGPIDLTLKTGETKTAIATGKAASGSLTWEVPGSLTPGCAYVVEATSTGADGTVAESPSFCVEAPKKPFVQVSSPNGGETFAQETSVSIAWTKTDVTAVRVTLERDGTEVATLAGETTQLTLGWNVALDVEPACTYRIRVAATDGSASDTSDGPFCVEANTSPLVNVLDPHGNASWQAGQTGAIAWTSANIEFVAIELLKGGSVYRLIEGAAAATGTINWLIPQDMPVGCDYAVRISSTTDPTVFAVNGGNLCVTAPPAPALTVMLPHQGSVWDAGTPQELKWTSSFANNVRVELWSPRDEVFPITKATSNTGLLSWELPSDLPEADGYYVKIFRVGKPDEGGRSKPFKIRKLVADERPVLGAAKSVDGAPEGQRDGTFSIRYRILLQNTGNATVRDLRIDEKLSEVFSGALRWWVESLESEDLAVDPTFDGSRQANLLLPGNAVAAGDEVEVKLAVNVLPATSNQAFSNQVWVQGKTSRGTVLEDLSQTGTIADADGNGYPQDDSEPTVTIVQSDVLAVELASFEGQADGRRIALRWTTATEDRNAGFSIERAFEDEPFESLGFVEGAGTTSVPQDYSFVIGDADYGFYRFRLKVVNFDGAYDYSPEIEVRVVLPDEYFIEPAYPNPFNPEAIVRFGVAESQPVRLELHTVLGRRVKTLYEGIVRDRETITVRIDGGDLPSGTYLIRLIGRSVVGTSSVTLLR